MIKVNENQNYNTVSFQDLSMGDVFKYGDIFYMKTNKQQCATGEIKAVSFNGKLVSLSSTDQVIRIEDVEMTVNY